MDAGALIPVTVDAICDVYSLKRGFSRALRYE
jgi:hypothetical protein